MMLGNKRSAAAEESLEDGDKRTMKRAKELQAGLKATCPCFLKLMLRSHVTTTFKLHLPKTFCAAHLPKYNDTVVLLGETGREYKMNYLAHSSALCGGWKAFTIANKLLEGDVLVFQLIKRKPRKFKVHIVRAIKTREERCYYRRRKTREEEDDVHSEVCRSPKKSIHADSLLGNETIFAGVIYTTIGIAEAIKTAKVSLDSDQLKSWDRILKAFEEDGMNVGHLRDRLKRLEQLSTEYHSIDVEGKMKSRAEAKEEIKVLQLKLAETMKLVLSLDSDIDELEGKKRKIGHTFEDVASAPW